MREGGEDFIQGGLNSDDILGGNGDDTIFAITQAEPDGSGAGDDVSGGDGDDEIVGPDGGDILNGDNGDDILEGSDGDDLLRGGAGEDEMQGDEGDDIFTVDNGNDTIQEGSPQGSDTIVTSIDFTVGQGVHVETMRTNSLAGTASIDLTGNTLDQQLTENAGSNIIHGKAGDDTLTGGLGGDRFVFDTALSASTNVDEIADFDVSDDSIRLDDAIFTAIALGDMSASRFKNIDTGSVDSSDRILYDGEDGDLFYDADGSATGFTRVLFARMDAGLALSNLDFLVI